MRLKIRGPHADVNNEPKNPTPSEPLTTSAAKSRAPSPKVDLVQVLETAGRLLVIAVGTRDGATVPPHRGRPDDSDTHDTR